MKKVLALIILSLIATPHAEASKKGKPGAPKITVTEKKRGAVPPLRLPAQNPMFGKNMPTAEQQKAFGQKQQAETEPLGSPYADSPKKIQNPVYVKQPPAPGATPPAGIGDQGLSPRSPKAFPPEPGQLPSAGQIQQPESMSSSPGSSSPEGPLTPRFPDSPRGDTPRNEGFPAPPAGSPFPSPPGTPRN